METKPDSRKRSAAECSKPERTSGLFCVLNSPQVAWCSWRSIVTGDYTNEELAGSGQLMQTGFMANESAVFSTLVTPWP
jgi:hypothetical protein